jgi:hypothetical protein
MERTLVNKKRKADERRAAEDERCNRREGETMQVRKCGVVAGEKDEQYEEMSEEEVVQWCSRYKSVEAMQHYMVNERKEPRSQERFLASLAKAALVKETPAALAAEYGNLYRWVWRFEHGMGGRTTREEDRAVDVSLFVRREVDAELKKFSKSVLVRGWRWVMQLRATDGKWVDWIYIQKSNRPGSELTVFSARDFPKGSTIGYCCGEARGMILEGDTDTEAVSQNLRIDRSNAVELVNIEECWTYRNRKGEWQTVFAKKVNVEEEGGQALYLGMHYLNSVCYGYELGSREYDKAKKSHNCLLAHDGSVRASKKIPPNVELLLLKEEGEREDEVANKVTLCNE